jgi:hypothetical protein
MDRDFCFGGFPKFPSNNINLSILSERYHGFFRVPPQGKVYFNAILKQYLKSQGFGG